MAKNTSGALMALLDRLSTIRSRKPIRWLFVIDPSKYAPNVPATAMHRMPNGRDKAAAKTRASTSRLPLVQHEDCAPGGLPASRKPITASTTKQDYKEDDDNYCTHALSLVLFGQRLPYSFRRTTVAFVYH
jgi:hypothetical protein